MFRLLYFFCVCTYWLKRIGANKRQARSVLHQENAFHLRKNTFSDENDISYPKTKKRRRRTIAFSNSKPWRTVRLATHDQCLREGAHVRHHTSLLLLDLVSSAIFRRLCSELLYFGKELLVAQRMSEVDCSADCSADCSTDWRDGCKVNIETMPD